jgi:hypothetical protein
MVMNKLVECELVAESKVLSDNLLLYHLHGMKPRLPWWEVNAMEQVNIEKHSVDPHCVFKLIAN